MKGTIVSIAVIAAVVAITMGESIMDHLEMMEELRFRQQCYWEENFRNRNKVNLKKKESA